MRLLIVIIGTMMAMFLVPTQPMDYTSQYPNQNQSQTSASSPDSVSTSVNRISPSVSHVNTLSNSDLSFATWHSRLGHPSGDTMKLVSKLCNIPIINETCFDFFSHCCIGLVGFIC